jgi:heat shock protein HslJ
MRNIGSVNGKRSEISMRKISKRRALFAILAMAMASGAGFYALSSGQAETSPVIKVAANANVDWAGEWTRMELAGKEGQLAPLPDFAKLLFQVDKDRNVSFSVGCNRIGTQLVPGEGNAITFAPGMATRMACPGELGDLEQRATDALDRVRSYEVRDGAVAFLDEAGQDVMLIAR